MFTGSSASGQQRVCGGNPETEKWDHIAAVFDGASGTTLYLNGQDIGSGGIDFDSSGINLRIGLRSGGDQYFDGKVDEVIIYDRTLDVGEIQSIFDAGRS